MSAVLLSTRMSGERKLHGSNVVSYTASHKPASWIFGVPKKTVFLRRLSHSAPHTMRSLGLRRPWRMQLITCHQGTRYALWGIIVFTLAKRHGPSSPCVLLTDLRIEQSLADFHRAWSGWGIGEAGVSPSGLTPWQIC